MENENGAQGQENNQGAQNQPANNQPAQNDSVDPLELLAMTGSVSKETLDGIAAARKEATQNIQNQAAQKGEENKSENKGENKGEENKGEENKGENKGEEKKEQKNENKEEGQKSVFGLGKNKGKGNQEIVIENTDHLFGVIKSQFGQEYKDLKELPKFFESVQKIRKDAQRVPDLEKEAKTWKGIVEALPEDLLESVKAFHSGQDYVKPIANRPKFDFGKKVDDQDITALVSHYFPGKFTPEDFKEATKSPAMEIAMEAAKEKFNNEKQTFDTRRASLQANAQKQIEAQKLALKGSEDHLRQSFPDIEDDAIKEAVKIFEGGTQSVMSHFYNTDGTVKPEGMKMFMMAKYGESEIQRMMGIASNITETKINEELLSRGADGKGPKQTQTKTTLSKEAQERISEIQTLVKQRQKTY